MSADSADMRPTSVAAVMTRRREAREAEEQRRAEVQERADKRRPTFGGSTT